MTCASYWGSFADRRPDKSPDLPPIPSSTLSQVICGQNSIVPPSHIRCLAYLALLIRVHTSTLSTLPRGLDLVYTHTTHRA